MNVKSSGMCEIGNGRVEIKWTAAYCRLPCCLSRWSRGLFAYCLHMWERVQDLGLTTQKDGGGVFLRNVGTHQNLWYHIREV